MCGKDRGVRAINTRQSYETVASLSDDEILGQLVVELLEAGKALNRKALCTKLLSRIELAESAEEQQRYQDIMQLVLETYE